MNVMVKAQAKNYGNLKLASPTMSQDSLNGHFKIEGETIIVCKLF